MFLGMSDKFLLKVRHYLLKRKTLEHSVSVQGRFAVFWKAVCVRADAVAQRLS